MILPLVEAFIRSRFWRSFALCRSWLALRQAIVKPPCFGLDRPIATFGVDGAFENDPRDCWSNVSLLDLATTHSPLKERLPLWL